MKKRSKRIIGIILVAIIYIGIMWIFPWFTLGDKTAFGKTELYLHGAVGLSLGIAAALSWAFN